MLVFIVFCGSTIRSVYSSEQAAIDECVYLNSMGKIISHYAEIRVKDSFKILSE